MTKRTSSDSGQMKKENRSGSLSAKRWKQDQMVSLRKI